MEAQKLKLIAFRAIVLEQRQPGANVASAVRMAVEMLKEYQGGKRRVSQSLRGRLAAIVRGGWRTYDEAAKKPIIGAHIGVLPLEEEPEHADT